jgi:formamidopyrimidine-DNA glycosylase
LQGRKQPVKSFLLDQRQIAGLGNIYADESLFRAGIHPLRVSGGLSHRETEKLWRQIRQVLREAIAAGGSTTHDYQTLDGKLGEFQRHHRVYRRAGEPCLDCGATIERCVMGGRGTHFCPHCQPQSLSAEK